MQQIQNKNLSNMYKIENYHVYVQYDDYEIIIKAIPINENHKHYFLGIFERDIEIGNEYVFKFSNIKRRGDKILVEQTGYSPLKLKLMPK